MKITLHIQGSPVELNIEDIHFIKPRSFGDVTFGSLVVTPDQKLEVDESCEIISQALRVLKGIASLVPDYNFDPSK